MSRKIRLLIGAGLACLATAAMTIPGSIATARAPGDLITYTSFDDASGLTLNGVATIATGTAGTRVLRLTNSTDHVSGSAWSATRLDTSKSFTTTFDATLGPEGTYSDGIAFVLQGVGDTALGWNGGGIGYRTIVPSVAVEFDTYRNSFEDNRNHVSVVSNGNVMKPLVSRRAPVVLANYVFRATIGYDAPSQALRVWVTRPGSSEPGKLVVKTKVSIASKMDGEPAYVGFTGANGSMHSNQDVLNWSLTGTS